MGRSTRGSADSAFNDDFAFWTPNGQMEASFGVSFGCCNGLPTMGWRGNANGMGWWRRGLGFATETRRLQGRFCQTVLRVSRRHRKDANTTSSLV